MICFAVCISFYVEWLVSSDMLRGHIYCSSLKFEQELFASFLVIKLIKSLARLLVWPDLKPIKQWPVVLYDIYAINR